MSRVVRFTHAVATKPLETIEAIVSLAMFLGGIWLVGPFYNAAETSPGRVTDSVLVPTIMGAVQILLGVLLAYALKNYGWPRRQRVRSTVTFVTFLLLLFYGFSQVFIWGLTRVTWISTFTIALIMGVAHLRLKWEMVVRDGA